MTKVVITAEVENLAQWEEDFRSHGDLFRKQTVSKPISIATTESNEVALIFEPEDLGTFMKLLESDGPVAMANDGVKKESVKIFVVNKEFEL